jgi:recombinational DNA repair protein (RecF pathway)
MRVQLTRHRSGHLAQDTLKTAAESSVLWQPQHIRHDAQGFALACLYLELVLKSALPMQDNQHGLPSEHAGLFNVLSNGLFFLDQALKVQRFEWSSHFTLFMSKFLLHLGILPDESVCVYCGAELANEFQTPLVIEQGGYACASCVGQLNGKMENISLRPYLAQAVRLKYQDWTQMQASHREICTRLIEFWGYHFQVRLPELTSYRLLF